MTGTSPHRHEAFVMIRILERFAAIGALPSDTDDERIRKGALTLSCGII